MKNNNNSSKKKPSFKVGSKARKALKAAAARESRASGGECIEEKQTKSFRYDEEKDEELKRLRALYASGAVGEKDEGNTECNNWHAIDVNSQFLVGSSEEGFVSLEVLSTEKEGEKDDAKTKKTKNETAKKSASKNDNNDDGSITVREKEKENEKEDGREKKEATKSKASNAKEARILKRKKRWKEKVEEAKKRNLTDLTVGPVLTKTTEQMLTHVRQILSQIEGSKVLFGGKELQNHNIPERYGAIEPTAVFVPLKEMLKTRDNFELVTTEIFGPFQIVVEYDDSTLPDVLKAMEKMENHLTAAIVSNDVDFRRKVLSETVNGTTYVGNRARTTGAPQNHWFGPAGDPRAGGIGTKEAIQLVWSSHREVIVDDNESSKKNWTQPAQS